MFNEVDDELPGAGLRARGSGRWRQRPVHGRRQMLPRAVLVLLATLIDVPCHAEDYALMVGVSEYPALGPNDQLRGPKNDVALMKEVLAGRGLDPAHIRILADGIEGAELPIRAAILKALRDLAERMGEGDRLYLHLSGHATQQPNGQLDTDYEPDGLDEVFLPRDVTSWDPRGATIENGIVDDEIGELIGRLLDKGAFVWLMADTCNAGTILRGASPKRIGYRGIDPGSLGVPSAPGGAERGSEGWQAASFGVEIPARPGTRRGIDAGGGSDAGEHPTGGYVAYYAARAGEPEPEMPLPEAAEGARWHGLLTYRLADALSATQRQGGMMTYRLLGERIRHGYRGRFSPTPLFEGTGLDVNVLGTEGGGSGDPILQWAIRKPGSSGSIRIPIGRLAQIGEGSRFALLAKPDDATESALGFADVRRAFDLSAELEPIAAEGKPAPAWDAIPIGAYARLVGRAIDFGVRVARPELPQDASEHERAAVALVDRLAAQHGPEGIQLHWVAAGEPADLRLGFTPRDSAQCKIAAGPNTLLWIAESDGGVRCDGAHQSIGIDLDRPEAKVQTLLLDTLQRIAKVLNLSRVAERIANSPAGTLIDVDLRIQPGGSNRQQDRVAIRLTPEVIASPKPGDRILLDLKNTSDRVLDINIFFVDGRYGIGRIQAPGDNSPMTLEPGQSIESIGGTISGKIQGQEQIIVVAVEHLQQQAALDLGFLTQPRLEPRRASEDKQRPGDDIIGLFEAAGFGAGGTRGILLSGAREAAVAVYRWRLDSRGWSE